MRGVGLPPRSAQANANFFGFPECSWFSKRGSKCPNFPLVCVAPRSEPRLAAFAREPFLGLCRGMEPTIYSCCPLRACVATRPHANPSLIGLRSNVTLSAGFAMLANMSRLVTHAKLASAGAGPFSRQWPVWAIDPDQRVFPFIMQPFRSHH